MAGLAAGRGLDNASVRLAMMSARVEAATLSFERNRKRKLRALEDLRDADEGMKSAAQEMEIMTAGIRALMGEAGYTGEMK